MSKLLHKKGLSKKTEELELLTEDDVDDDTDDYSDERYFPYKRPILSAHKVASGKQPIRKTVALSTKEHRYQKKEKSAQVTSHKRHILLRWPIGSPKK